MPDEKVWWEVALERRKRLGLTQIDLAEMSGVSVRLIKEMESGKANPRWDRMSKVLEPLGLVLAAVDRVSHG
jgi:predicted transcriptional regulator